MGFEDGREAAEQVVVPEDPEAAFAVFVLRQHIFREAAADGGTRVRCGLQRKQPGAGVADHLTGERQRGGAVECGIARLLAEVCEIQVVDDLGDQLVEVVDEDDPGVDVTGHTQ